jgi:pseudouridine-5'-phosphate glycosidase/pseudouridine kinase
MMFGPASWQAPIRLASTRPNFGQHILIFSRSISQELNERLKGWVRPTGWTKPKRWEPEGPSPVFKVSPEVAQAVRKNLPVVALETTIYTHGFPYPDNVALALDLERIVRENGAIPATIGVVNGVAKVGLTSDQIKMLAEGAGKPETMKVSRRDLPYILGMVSRTKFSFHLMLLSEVFKIYAHNTT